MKIVSGGQTGVDRAALDFALESGIDAGGWCPEGRTAEDGRIPDKYPVIELPNSGYRQQTKRNVRDSDGTVIIYYEYPTVGTEQTITFCINEHKSYLLIDAQELTIHRAAEKLLSFIVDRNIQTLNVAGPRAGGEPRGYDFTKSVLVEVNLHL